MRDRALLHTAMSGEVGDAQFGKGEGGEYFDAGGIGKDGEKGRQAVERGDGRQIVVNEAVLVTVGFGLHGVFSFGRRGSSAAHT